MSDLTTVTRRLKDEVGLSGQEARRIATKLNRLAESVPWATPLVIRDSRTGTFSPGPGNRAGSKTAKRKSARRAAKKR